MTTMEVIEELDILINLLTETTNAMGHVGIALQAMAVSKEYEIAKDAAAANQMYNDPFYNYFQQASGDLHAQYPLRKMALLEALVAYKRYLSPRRASND
ncbi:MAG: Unknown protein [uncultured Aureispira sp.]|uniref:Uncharacterized protein n=1 Tax=uncultured Aureispira sp. TaxID=1331704 RepID=A0A6S6T849_9BACT|nr:MAG: Unknown protein [uncultured Aureispira sp.]